MGTNHGDFSGNAVAFSGVRLEEATNVTELTGQFVRTMNQTMAEIMPKWPDTMNAPVMRQPIQAPPPETPPPEAAQFNVVVNGQTYGPYGLDALAQMATQGYITAESMVWRQGMTTWQAAGTLPELAPLVAGTPPPLP